MKLPKNKADNPFHLTPNGPMLIGTARLYLQPCYFLLPIHESTAIIDYRGEHKGQLYVNLVPVPPRDEDTMNLKEEELFFEEEELAELKGEPLTLRLEVKKCMGLPSKYSSRVFVAYKFFYDSSEVRSEVCPDTTINPLLNYERTLLVDIIEDEFVEYIKSGILEFSVYGEQPVVKEDDEEEEEKSSSSSAGAVKGGKHKGNAGAVSGAVSERLQKLEAVLRAITEQVDPAAAALPASDRDKLLKDAPESIVGKVKELVVRHAGLEQENLVLRSPVKARPASGSAASVAAAAETAALKKQLEALKLSSAASASASGSVLDENQSLKAALASLKAHSSPQASELAELRQSKEAHERALAAGEAKLAALKAALDKKEAEAAELRSIQSKEAQLNRELQERLSAAGGGGGDDQSVAALRRDLESARAKVASASTSSSDAGLASSIARKDAELEELRRQLKAAQDQKKSSACVIL